MANKKTRPAANATERERARLYQARRDFQQSLGDRRRRDNLIAGVVGGVLIVGLFAAQWAYTAVGPGTPAPSPSATMDAPEPSVTGTPSPSVAPTDTGTPEPTQSPTP